MSWAGRALMVLVVVAAAGGTLCSAQKTGTVTFYTSQFPAGKQLKAEFAPATRIPFRGWLFDGKRALAHANSGRFVSFRLQAGQHSLIVSWNKRDRDKMAKKALTLDVAPGQHYCVKLYARFVNSYVVLGWGAVDSRMELVPCQQAAQEAQGDKPLEDKRIDPSARPEVSPSATFPNF